jgi:fibronectin-binding autotransporter adhesin
MEARTLLSNVSWTGNAHDNNWDTPGNWSTDSLPGMGDDVTIDTSADVVHSDSVTDKINSLTSSQPLTISGGTLSIASAFTTSSTLTISGGTLNDPGAITVGGLLTLSGGGISGSGTVTANGGTLINPPNSSLVLDGCTLINPAGQTATWSGVGSDGVQMDDGAVFNNLGTFLAQTHGRIGDGQGAGSAFNNEGSFTKSTDSGSLEFGQGVTFNNDGGTVDVQTGTLSLGTGGTDTAGSYTSESGATLELGGPRTLDADSTIAGAGTVDFGYFGTAATISMQGTYNVTGATIDESYDGTVNIGGTVDSIGTAFTMAEGGTLNFTTAFPGSAGTIATVNLSGVSMANFGTNALTVTTLTNSSDLTSTADITISGLTTLSGGSISGSGDVTANGGILMNGTSLLDGRSLINPAGQTATFTGGGALGIGLQMGDGAVFNNFGTFLVQTHGFIEQGFGAAAVFNNQGSFVKSTDSGVLEVTPSIVFNVNGGTVDVQTGTLNLQGGGINTSAAYTIESGATLDFGGDSYFTFDNASTVSGTGNLIKDGLGTSSITLDGSSPLFTGPTTVNAGMFLVDGSQSNNPITATDSTVGGSGTVGPITTVGSTVSPGATRLLNGPGILTVQGDVTMNSTSTYTVELNGPNPGTGGYSQLDAMGTVNLAGSTLSASLGFTPSIGESFTIIHSTAPIMHTFNGLAEGATLTIGSVPFRIT